MSWLYEWSSITSHLRMSGIHHRGSHDYRAINRANNNKYANRYHHDDDHYHHDDDHYHHGDEHHCCPV